MSYQLIYRQIKREVKIMNKHYYLVIDTETTGALDNAIVYDLGGAIVDRHGKVYETFSFVIKEMWHDNWEMLKSAYYADKLPNYQRELINGQRTLVTYYQAKQHIENLCEEYNVKAIMAHNAMFDYKATRNTQKFLTDGKYSSFLPYGIEIWDTMKMAQDVVATKKSYIKFCEENGYMTNHKKPRVQVKAEVLYRFISGNNEFIESHTGLEDVLIEKEIFAYCVKQHKAMRRNLFEK